jgi:hopene-associated glycosyltransferase HpnB
MDWRTGFTLAAAAVPVAIWIYLLVGRGQFWRVERQLGKAAPPGNVVRRVAVVIPARNEAGAIGRAVTSLLRQRFSGSIHIIIVDDASTDGTSEEALAAADEAQRKEAVTVMQGRPLPLGWTGKMWAVFQGVEKALESNPDFLLLTDADIEHGPHALSELVSRAEADSYDLVSFMVKLQTGTLAERALIPAFVFFFFLLYPPAWIADSNRGMAGAAGGCMLVRPERLLSSGGIEAIRDEVIDDCALARLMKNAEGRIWLGLTDETRSIRGYGTFRELERMIARTAFNQLKHSPLLLAGTVVGLMVIYVLPVVFTFSGRPAGMLFGIVAWLLMSGCYLPMVRFYRQNRLWTLALPAIAVFYAAATVHSALKYWSGKGGEWKGRVQDAKPGTQV